MFNLKSKIMNEFEKEEVQKASEKKEANQNPQKLSLRDLLEVQGGLDFDDYMRSCISMQCKSGAVNCESGM